MNEIGDIVEEGMLKELDRKKFRLTDCPYDLNMTDCEHTEGQCDRCPHNTKWLEENIP